MSHSHQHHEGIQHGSATQASPFSPAEIAAFQKDDRHAGGAVVLLMGIIFTIGVLLYGLIDILIS